MESTMMDAAGVVRQGLLGVCTRPSWVEALGAVPCYEWEKRQAW